MNRLNENQDEIPTELSELLSELQADRGVQLSLEVPQVRERRYSEPGGGSQKDHKGELRIPGLKVERGRVTGSPAVVYRDASDVRTILSLTDENAQRRLAKTIIAEQLSVREVERLVRNEAPRAERSKSKPRTQDPNVATAETKLRRKFGTKVRIIQQPGSQRGRIELEFYSADDLNRIYELLLESRSAAAQV